MADSPVPNPPVQPILDVRRLSVRFGDLAVLDEVSFTVAAGETLAILGPNGAGKTVLFNALIGAIPYEGEIRWAPGTRIGYVPQKLDIERDVPITGLDFLRARGALARVDEAATRHALDLVGISGAVAGRPIGVLSGGQFQRLLIAFALVGRPTVLLLDEPTSGVDEPGQEQLNDLVERVQREHGLTVLFISHELTIVHRRATNVLCLAGGHAWIGPPSSTLTPELLHRIYGTGVSYHWHEH